MAEQDFSEKLSYRRDKVNNFYHTLDRMYYSFEENRPRSQGDYDEFVAKIRRDLQNLADDISYFARNEL